MCVACRTVVCSSFSHSFLSGNISSFYLWTNSLEIIKSLIYMYIRKSCRGHPASCVRPWSSKREKEKELNFYILYCKNALTFHQKGCVFDNLIEASKILKQRGCACGLQLSNSIDCTYTKFVVCRLMLYWCSTWLDLSQVKKNYGEKTSGKNCKNVQTEKFL